MPHDERAPILVLVRDLLFASKITATAQAARVPVRVIRDVAALDEQAGSRLIVDLAEPGAIDAAQRWKQRVGGAVIGFVSHVDQATIDAARAAGFDQVLARGRFVAELPELMR